MLRPAYRPGDARGGNLEDVPRPQAPGLVQPFFQRPGDPGAVFDGNSGARCSIGPIDPHLQEGAGPRAALADVRQLKAERGDPRSNLSSQFREIVEHRLGKKSAGRLRPLVAICNIDGGESPGKPTITEPEGLPDRPPCDRPILS